MRVNPKIKEYSAYIVMGLLTFIWAADALVTSKALESINQVLLLNAKDLAALPVIMIFAAVTDGIHRPNKYALMSIIISGIFGDAVYYLCEYTAYTYLPVGTVALCSGTLPIFSYAFDCIIKRRMPSVKILVIMGVVFAGLVPVVSAYGLGSGSWKGYVVLLGCIVSWIICGNVVYYTDKKSNISSTGVTFWRALIGIIVLLPYTLTHLSGFSVLSVKEGLIYIVFMGALVNGLGLVMEMKGMSDLGSTATGIFLSALPVLTAVGGYIFLKETMTVPRCIGSAIVIAACFCFVLESEKEAKAEEQNKPKQ